MFLLKSKQPWISKSQLFGLLKMLKFYVYIAWQARISLRLKEHLPGPGEQLPALGES